MVKQLKIPRISLEIVRYNDLRAKSATMPKLLFYISTVLSWFCANVNCIQVLRAFLSYCLETRLLADLLYSHIDIISLMLELIKVFMY